MITLNFAMPSDAAIIQKLAREIWNENYQEMITQKQIDYMLEKFYAAETILKDMESGQNYFLIKSDEDELLGYISFTEKKPGSWFMNKFYMKTLEQRKNYGAEAMKIWESNYNPNELRLQVNRKNIKAVNFYFKNGFTIESVGDFDIGGGFTMDDFIMIKNYAT